MKEQKHPSQNRPAMWNTRAALLLVCAIVTLATIVAYAGDGWLSVTTCFLMDGIPALAWGVAAAALGELVLGMILKKPEPGEGALRFATAAGLGLGIYSLLALGMGLAGFLNAMVVWGLAIVPPAVFLGRLYWRQKDLLNQSMSPVLERWLFARVDWLWFFVLLMPFLGMALVGAAIMPGELWRPDDPHPYDVMVYHLQVPREWYELGRIVPLHHNVYSYFPFNVEMQYLLGMYLKGGPWAGMYFAQHLSLVYSAVGLIAIYGATRMRYGAAGAALATTAAGSLPWMTMLACVAYVESGMLCYTSLALAWLMMALPRPGGHDGSSETTSGMSASVSDAASCSRMGEIVIAGVMVGLACGVKFTAAPMVLAAGSVGYAVAMLGANSGIKRIVRDVAIFGIVGMAVVSPWLLRNMAWSENPVFPLAMNVLGPGHFTPVQVERFNIAHSARPEQRPISARLEAAKWEIGFNWKYNFIFWPLAIAALVLRRRDRGMWMMLIVLLLMLLCWMSVTHLMSRFFVIGIPAAALMIGSICTKRAILASFILVTFAAMGGWFGVDTLRSPGMDKPMEEAARLGNLGLFNIQDMRWLQPEFLKEAESAGRSIVLAGDSRAFLHQMPMTRLKYRTVFDVDVKPGQSVVDAWIGSENQPLDARTMVIVDPVELERLSKTYFSIPALPAEVNWPRDKAFVYEKK